MSLRTAAFATTVLHAFVGIAQHLIANDTGLIPATLAYYVAACGLVSCYAALIRSVGERPSRESWVLLIGVPLLIQIGWVLSLPVLSIDAYSYLVDAAHTYSGLNPYEHAVKEAAGTDLGRKLAAYGWRPAHGVSPYGPVWMNLVSAVGPFADDVEVGVRLLKVIAFSATTLTAWLIFRAAPPTVRVRALSAFWWNPVVIIESAGEGHNDAVMVAAVILSVWCLRRDANVAAAAALTAAVLTKWIPALFAPAYLAYAWRNGRVTTRTLGSAGAVVAALTAVAYLPLWAGANTFAGILSATGPRFAASTTGVFGYVLGDYPTAWGALRLCAASAMVVAAIWAAGRARTIPDLMRAAATIALTYVLIAAPVYWPWYVLMPIALLALADDVPLVIVLTMTSRVVAPLNLIRVHNGLSATTQVWLTTVVALWLPLAYVAWRTVKERRTIGCSRSTGR